jgi:phage-related holin
VKIEDNILTGAIIKNINKQKQKINNTKQYTINEKLLIIKGLNMALNRVHTVYQDDDYRSKAGLSLLNKGIIGEFTEDELTEYAVFQHELQEECKEELKKQNIACDHNIEVGMMIETPSSILLVEDFAKEVDFFSIGTNDLTQYLLAVDRGNKKISSMLCSTGIIKKITVFIAVAVANSIQALLGDSIPLREIIITFYVGCEGLSILENLGEMGIPFPKKLKDVLLQLKNKEE